MTLIARLSPREAERHVGRRLDRRRSYGWDGQELYELARYSTTCCGCSCDCGEGYGCSHGASGCAECGFTGRNRVSYWIEHETMEKLRRHERTERGCERVSGSPRNTPSFGTS